MRFYGDYHVHSPFSHGKDPIKDSIKAAEKKGLKEIAITDHGFAHSLYAVKREQIPTMRAETEAFDSSVKTYLGIEANLMGYNGDIDINHEDMEKLDILIVGYHRFVTGAFLDFSLPNLFSAYTHIGIDKVRVRNTDAIIKAVERFPIDIISHPGADFPIDITAVAEACAHFGTFLELNGKRILSDEDALRVLETPAVFIASSDAHGADRVGDFFAAEALIKRLSIPEDRIANLGKLPVFRKGIRRAENGAEDK